MRRVMLWGLGLIGGLALIAGGWLYWQSPTRALAACPPFDDAQAKPLFTTALMDPNTVVTITPLGTISPPGHVTPTNHLYLNVKDGNEIKPELATPVYAPGDLLITAIHRDLDARGGSESTHDYRIEAFACKQVSVLLDHLHDLTPELTEVFETNKDDCDTHTVSSYQTITYCHASTREKIAAGTQIGLAGGAAATGLDLGVYDRRKPKLKFANPSRYGSDEPYTACGLDEFAESLKSQLYSKLGRQSARRTIEPRCGQIDQDAIGTTQGNWWTLDAGSGNGPESWKNSLSLVHDNVDPTQGVLAHGGKLGPASRTLFTVVSTGTINREPSEITSGETIYCYEGPTIASQGSGTDRSPHRFLIQLPTAERLKAEYQPGSCTDSHTFTTPIEYER